MAIQLRPLLTRTAAALGLAVAVGAPLLTPTSANAQWCAYHPCGYYHPHYYYRPPVYYHPPVYVPGPRIWIPGHYRGPYFIPGHWR